MNASLIASPFKGVVSVLVCAILITSCSSGGGSKPVVAPKLTCSEKIGTGTYVSTSIDGAKNFDNTCPTASSLIQQGISFTKQTTSYSCSSPSSTTENPHSTTIAENVQLQVKQCSAPVSNLNYCAGIKDEISTTGSDKYKCSTGFSKAANEGKSGVGIKIATFIADYTPNAVGFNGKPVSTYLAGSSFQSGFGFEGEGNKEINLFIGDSNVKYSNIGGLLPNLDHLYLTPSTSLFNKDYAADAVNYFYNNGVRVLNFSGNSNKLSTAVDIETYLERFYGTFQLLIDKKMILTTSTGSSLGLNAYSVVPKLRPELIDATISAVAVTLPSDGMLGIGSTPIVFGSPCAETAVWCLSAPSGASLIKYNGSGIETPPTTDPNLIGPVGYDQVAAPTVAAAAALVWNEFSWLSGYQLKQTLFTTAIDLGAVGVDPVYGNGFVDVYSALKGTKEFKETWTTDVSVGTFVFQNNISGAGGLIKNGLGKLILSGANTFTGNINVNQGELAITNVVTSNIAVGAAGTFSGKGNVLASSLSNGSLVNNGKVAIEGGNLSLAGNYSQATPANLTVDVNSTLNVNGTASIAGAFTLKVPDSYVISGAINPALNAIGGLTGVFSSTNSSSALFSLSATYTTNLVNVALTRIASKSVVASNSMDYLLDSGANRLDNVFDTIDQQLNSGQSVTSNILNSAAKIQSIETVEQLKATIESLSGQAYANQHTLLQKSASQAKEWSISQSYAENQDLIFDARFSSFNGNSNASDGMNEQHIGNQFTVGAGKKWGNGWQGGASFNVSEYEGNYDRSGGYFESDSAGLDLFVSKNLSNNWVANAQLGYFQADSQVERSILLRESSSIAQGKQTNRLFRSAIELGKQLPNGKVFVGIRNDWVAMDGFNEKGNSGFELIAKNSLRSQTVLELGTQINKQLRFSNGWSLEAVSGLIYSKRIVGSSFGFSARYTDIEGDFEIQGADEADQVFWFNFGLSAQKGLNKFSLYLDDAQSLDNAHSISTSYRFEF